MAGRYTLDQVTQVQVPSAVILDTLKVLRTAGHGGNEALVLWVGEVNEGSAKVVTHLVPPQNPVQSESGVGYFVNSQTLFALNRFLREHHLRLIGQVHSHPGAAYHSSTDDAYAIVTSEGGFSLVVPNFGHVGPTLDAWAVYRLTAGQWLELTAGKVRTTFITT